MTSDSPTPENPATPELASPAALARRRLLWLIFAVTATGIMSNTLLTPNVPDILADFSKPDSAAGLLIASGPLPAIVLAPIIGVLADRYGRRAVLAPCLLLFGIGGILSGLAPSYSLLVASRFLQGMGGAGLIGMSVVLISDNWSGQDRAKYIGYNAAVLTICIALFPAVGGALAELGTWRYATFPFVLAMPMAALLWRRLPGGDGDPDVKIADQIARTAATLRNRTIATTIAIGFTIFVLIFGLFLTVFPLLLEDRFGLSAGRRGLVIAVSALSSTVASLTLSRLKSKFRARGVVIGSLAGFAVAYAIVGIAPALWIVLGAALVYGFGEGASIPILQNVVAGLSTPENRGAVISVWVSGVRTGQVVGPLVVGALLAVTTQTAVFLIAAGIAGALTIVVATTGYARAIE